MYSCFSTLLLPQSSPISVLSFSPGNGQEAIFISANEGGLATVANLAGTKGPVLLQSQEFYITSIAWTGSKTFVSGWNNGMVVEMEVDRAAERRKCLSIISYFDRKMPYCVQHLIARLFGEDLYVAAAAGSHLHVWRRKRAACWERIYVFDGLPESFTGDPAGYTFTYIAFSTNVGGLRLSATLLGGYFCVWDCLDNSPTVSGVQLASRIGSACLVEDCGTLKLAALNLHNGVDIYDIPSRLPPSKFTSIALKPKFFIEAPTAKPVSVPLTFLPTYGSVLLGGFGTGALILSLDDGVRTPLTHPGLSDCIFLATASTDSVRIATACRGPANTGEIKIWGIDGEKSGLPVSSEENSIEITLVDLISSFIKAGGTWRMAPA